MKPETVKFLIEQAKAGKLGANINGDCVYRHDGKCCGVGALLPQDLPLTPSMNLLPVNVLVETEPDVEEYLLDTHSVSLDEAVTLQLCHDRSFNDEIFDANDFCERLIDHFGQPA